jgi:hypothetical protein
MDFELVSDLSVFCSFLVSRYLIEIAVLYPLLDLSLT